MDPRTARFPVRDFQIFLDPGRSRPNQAGPSQSRISQTFSVLDRPVLNIAILFRLGPIWPRIGPNGLVLDQSVVVRGSLVTPVVKPI